VPEIRLDVRLLRPGALVGGIRGGRCVLVRAVPEAGSGAAWIAARAAGLPVPDVSEARCGERAVLVAPQVAGQPLAPAVADVAVGQAAALGSGLVACGVAVSRLRAGDLQVCDGVLTVQAPVAGGPAEGDDEAVAFAAMVAAACASEPAGEPPNRRRAVPLAIAAVAALAVVVTLTPWHSPPAAPPARAATSAAAPVLDAPKPEPVAGPAPPRARIRRATARPRGGDAAAPRPRRSRKAARAAAERRARVGRSRTPPPRAPAPPGDDVPVAGGNADPLPAR
jgi:hypothetical protein